MKTFGSHGNLLRTMLAALFATTLVSAASAQEPKLLADTSEVRVTVRDTTGMPIRDAKVEMLILNRGQDQGAMEVRTNDNGSIEQDIIPIGDVVRMQISAPGYKAYDINYPINGLVKDLVVRLKEQPVEEASVTAPKPDTNTPSQATFTYKEAQWVKRSPHRAVRKAHVVAKSAPKSAPAKNLVAASSQPALQK